ncbi:MAG: hypothetical protein ABH864_04960 [archaeon]
MVSGSSALSTLRGKIDEVERDHGFARRSVEEAEQKLEQLRRQRNDSYVELAQIYLPELDAQAVQSTLEGLRDTAQRAFEAKQDRMGELDRLMQESAVRRDELEGRLNEIGGKIKSLAKTRDETQAIVAQDLGDNQRYQQLIKTADGAKERFARNRARAEVFEKDIRGKIREYEGNELFMYLVGRRFGTEEAKGNWFTRALDLLVAQQVKFGKNKENYDFLVAIPDRIQVEIKRQEQALGNATAEMARIEEDASVRHGLPPILEQGALALETRNNFLEEIDASENAREKYEGARRALDTTRGEFYQGVVGEIASYLEGQSIEELRKRALETPDPRDDHIVERIDGLIRTISAEEGDLPAKREQEQELSRKLCDLRGIKQRFVNKDYESGRSYFDDGLDFDSLLLGFMAGRFSATSINGSIDNSQHFRPRPSYSSSSSSSSSSISSSSFSSGSSGFGGGSFSSGSGF